MGCRYVRSSQSAFQCIQGAESISISQGLWKLLCHAPGREWCLKHGCLGNSEWNENFSVDSFQLSLKAHFRVSCWLKQSGKFWLSDPLSWCHLKWWENMAFISENDQPQWCSRWGEFFLFIAGGFLSFDSLQILLTHQRSCSKCLLSGSFSTHKFQFCTC